MQNSPETGPCAQFERLSLITCLLHEGIDTREKLEGERSRLLQELSARRREFALCGCSPVLCVDQGQP